MRKYHDQFLGEESGGDTASLPSSTRSVFGGIKKLFYPREEIIRMMIRGTRPRKNRIEVWCYDDELAKIKANAKDTKLSNSEFLRNLGKGYEPKSAFDKEAIKGLAKLHADQDRLGGLLAQCLSESKGGSSPLKNVGPLLQEIESLQTFIAKKATRSSD